MNDKTSKGLIVLSGGMDSVTLLYDKRDEIAYALSFDYGSKHNGKELAMAKWHTKKTWHTAHNNTFELYERSFQIGFIKKWR